MRRTATLLFACLLALTACANSPGNEASENETSTGNIVVKSEEWPTIQDDLVRFIAAVESVLEGSSYEGTVFERPEIHIATAQGFCARLSVDDEFGLILDDYFASSGLANPSDDDLLFIGAILGAGVETLCPEQLDKLEL